MMRTRPGPLGLGSLALGGVLAMGTASTGDANAAVLLVVTGYFPRAAEAGMALLNGGRAA